MPASGKKVCFQFPERRLSYAKILQKRCATKEFYLFLRCSQSCYDMLRMSYGVTE